MGYISYFEIFVKASSGFPMVELTVLLLMFQAEIATLPEL